MFNNMGLSWGATFIKYSLYIVNFIFVITGIIILSVGVSVKAYYNDYSTFLDTKYFSTPNLLIAIGAIIFLISFLGCYGAIKENYCMIIAFCSLLILIFILELAAGIAGYALRDQTSDYLTEKLTNSINSYDINGTGDVTAMWDLIQREFECCGASGASDWINATSTGGLIPLSCCSPANGAVGTITCEITTESSTTESSTFESSTTESTTILTSESSSESSTEATTETTIPTEGENPDELKSPISGARDSATRNNTAQPYRTGCVVAFGSFIKEHAVTLGGVGIALAFIQLFGMIFSCILAKKVREQQPYT